MKHNSLTAPVYRQILLGSILLFSGWFAACTGAVDSTISQYLQTTVFQRAILTATYETTETPSISPIPPTNTPLPTQSLTPEPTRTSSPPPTETPQSSPTAPSLPPLFRSDVLNPKISPQTYIQDDCEYLKLRWDPQKSAPGTVVMPVMFHSITGDEKDLSPDGSQIHEQDLTDFVSRAGELGFQTITTEQLVHFLERNDKIPSRSMILILDDRRPGVARVTFYPYLVEHNWTLTLGWLIGDTDQKPSSYLKEVPEETFKTLWQQIEAYYALGVFDIQAHGYIHNINASETSTDAFLRHELEDSRLVLQDHFYCKDQTIGEEIENCETNQPLAYIWPGGGFSKRAVEIAREAGYHVGFTTNPRGPLLFNWIPLAEERDPDSPYWLPEIPVNDPLLVLPRYWSKDALYRLEDVVAVAEEAIAYAQAYETVEKAYLASACQVAQPELIQP